MRRVAEALRVGGLVFLLASCGRGGKEPSPLAADHLALRATLATDSAGLGDPVRLSVEAIVPAGSRVAIETPGDSIGGWRILGARPPTQKRVGGFDRWRRDLRIASYRLGDVGPDTLRVRAVTSRGESLRLAYAPRALRVGGVLQAGERTDVSKARDIRDVLPTGTPVWPWVIAALAAVGAAAWFAVRRLRARRRAAPEAAVPSGPSPEEEFDAAIAELLAKGLLERGMVREFYYGVSGAVRLYLERKSGLPLLESTSAEVASLLGPRIRGEFERVALGEWLSEGDLVKYARMERLQGEANRYLLHSRDLVKRLSIVWEPAAIPPGQADTTRPESAAAGQAPPATPDAHPATKDAS